MRKAFEYPLRSVGTALTVAGAAVVFFVLILPSIAAGSSPSGKYKVTGYLNQKSQTTAKLYVDHWFYLTGGNFDKASLVDVWCWEGNDTEGFKWTPVTDFGVVSSKLMWVDLSNDCSGRGPSDSQGPVAVEWDLAGTPDPADDLYVIGPAKASINENAASFDT